MIEVRVCPRCPRVLPLESLRCPACGGPLTSETRTGVGRALAATELSVPAAGWPAPHRLVVVELEGGGRVLALSPDELPEPGCRGRVERSRDGRFHFLG